MEGWRDGIKSERCGWIFRTERDERRQESGNEKAVAERCMSSVGQKQR